MSQRKSTHTLKSRVPKTASRVVLVIGVIISFLLALAVEKSVLDEQFEENKRRLEKVKNDIELSLEQYLHPLQGVVGLFHSHDNYLASQRYRHFSEARELYRNFPGALGFGFIRRISDRDINSYLRLMKRERPQFALGRIGTPAIGSESKELFVIEMVEPIEVNAKAIGLVVSDEQYRKEAALLSMRTGKPALTKSIQLVQANRKEPGFLYYLPLYKAGRVPATEGERLKAHVGWAYAPLLASEIIKFVKSRSPMAPAFEVYELSERNQKNLLFQSSPSGRSKTTRYQWSQEVLLPGQTWLLTGDLSSARLSSFDYFSFLGVLLLGLLTTYIAASQLATLEQESYLKSQMIRMAKSEAERATYDLKRKTEFLNRVIDALPAMIGYWGKDLRNQLSNRVYSQYFKMGPDEIVGRHISEVLPPEIFRKNEKYMKLALAGKEQEFEMILEDAHGRERMTMVKYLPDWIGGEVAGFSVIVIDLSDIRELERKNQESQSQLYAKSKLSLLGEMAAGIAHEINNPLAIISGKAQLVRALINKSNLSDSEKEKILSNVSDVKLTVDRIAAIVKGLRAISRDSENDGYTDVAVSKIISDVLSLTKERSANRGIELNVEMATTETKLKCNEVQISQVLLNLISNSIDALEKLNEKWIRISARQLGQNLELRVTDSGPQIPEAIAEKIMQPFFTTKEVGKGTGLGLSISKGIVEKHKGQFVYDPVGGHTSFRIVLPLGGPLSKTGGEAA